MSPPRDPLLLLFPHGADRAGPVMQAARERNMSIVLLSNTQEHELPALLEPDDIAIQVESEHRGKTIEMHTMIIHCLCKLIDQSLFGPISDTP